MILVLHHDNLARNIYVVFFSTLSNLICMSQSAYGATSSYARSIWSLINIDEIPLDLSLLSILPLDIFFCSPMACFPNKNVSYIHEIKLPTWKGGHIELLSRVSGDAARMRVRQVGENWQEIVELKFNPMCHLHHQSHFDEHHLRN